MQLSMPPPAVRFVILFICKKFFDFCEKILAIRKNPSYNVPEIN